jgi:hypothetical protein
MGFYVIAHNMSAAFPQEIINRLSAGSETRPNDYYLPQVLEYVKDLEAAGYTWLTLQELCRNDMANPSWCCGGNCEYKPGFHAVFRVVDRYPHSKEVFPWRLAGMVTDSCYK